VRDALYLVKLFFRDRYTPLLHEFFTPADKKCASVLLSTRATARPRFGDFSNAKGAFYLVTPSGSREGQWEGRDPGRKDYYLGRNEDR
jgi:hypothetical protein